MKKASLSLLALILISSASSSFGMKKEENNTPNNYSWLKKGLIGVGAALAFIVVKEGGPVVYDQLSQIQMGSHTISCRLPSLALECYPTEAGFQCYDELQDGYDYGYCPIDSEEAWKPMQAEYALGTCPKVEGKRGKHPKPRRN